MRRAQLLIVLILIAGFSLAGFAAVIDIGRTPFASAWTRPTLILLGMGLCLSLLAVVAGDAPAGLVLTLLSGLPIAIAGYPVAHAPLFFVISAVVVSGAMAWSLRQTYGVVAGCSLLVFYLVFSVPRGFMGTEAFGFPISEPLPTERLAAVVALVAVPALVLATKRAMARLAEHRTESERLNQHIIRLSKVNADFQQYATILELESADRERKRIARDVHDTTGYYFTNLLMMLKAAIVSVPPEQESLRRLLSQALSQTQEGIDETRRALRKLRDVSPRSSIYESLGRLIDNFALVTGVQIAKYWNGPHGGLPSEYELLVFRTVQEGLTNAYRHGRSTRVEVFVDHGDRELSIGIYDNGTSTSVVKEGIGLAGMKERARQLGGALSLAPLPDGFGLVVRVPLEEDRHKEETYGNQDRTGRRPAAVH